MRRWFARLSVVLAAPSAAAQPATPAASPSASAAATAGARPAVSSSAAPSPAWPARLLAELERADGRTTADLGVYVRDLESDVSASYHAEESWYLASMVKLPVALAVLRSAEHGEHFLDTNLTLRADDYVDGAGPTNGFEPGAVFTVRTLLEQMMIYSDNTASDMLIGLVGIDAVNALAQETVPAGFGAITRLADVRRRIYGELTPAAVHLSGRDFVVLQRQGSDARRLQALAGLLSVPAASFGTRSLAQAYAAYYATGLNSARLDAYGELLVKLARGEILGPSGTAYLLQVMQRAQTGARRIKAGLPKSAPFAHKTGTQRARICDAGIIGSRAAGGRRVVVAACTRGDLPTARLEQSLKEVGEAIGRSGLLADEDHHGHTEPPVPASAVQPGAAGRQPGPGRRLD
ncbi:class A beta-lactamase [Pigmentiphaga soli]|uniref:Class A beta-lactamase n=1 Tax=Pigmentiphaga soli TaxID=1007095 RepID=A0ABP8GFY8_9BURK